MKNDTTTPPGVVYMNNSHQPDHENILLNPASAAASPGAAGAATTNSNSNVESDRVRTARTFSANMRAPHIIIDAPPRPDGNHNSTTANNSTALTTVNTNVSSKKTTSPSVNGHGPKKMLANGSNGEHKSPTTRKVKKKKNTVARPPDGGFGWVVVFASFMCNVIVDGIIFSFGFLLPEISAEFNESKATTAWIGSLQTGFYLIVGPVVSALAQKYDCWKITIIGSILTCIGFVLSYFAQNVITLYITFGLIGGIGFGFVFLPAIVTVGYYFESRRAFATGIAVCGSGVGNFILPPIIQHLIGSYGWRICLLWLAGLSLFCAVFGSFFRPLNIEPEEESEDSKNSKPLLQRIKEARAAEWTQSQETLDEDSPSGSQNSDPPPYSEVLTIIPLNDPPTNPDLLSVATPQRRRTRSNLSNMGGAVGRKGTSPRDEMLYSNLSLVILPHTRSIQNLSNDHDPRRTVSVATTLGSNGTVSPKSACSGFDLSLFKRPSFVLLAVSGFLCLVGFFIPFIYISDWARVLGYEPEKRAYILSVIGVTNTIGRVFCGWASDNRLNPLFLNNLSLTIGGICTILAPILFDSYTALIIYGSIFGFAVASFATLRSVITVELLGLERLTSAFGLLLLFQGLAVTIGSPIAGWFFDITGSYKYSFFLSGTTIALSGIMCYPLNAIARWEKKHFDKDDTKVSQI